MSDSPRDRKPSIRPGIEDEPHMQSVPQPGDPSEWAAAVRLDRELVRESAADRVEQTVWDEPALSAELVGGPGDDDLTYQHWLVRNIAATPLSKTWLVTLLVALAAGPWGVLGALFGSGGHWLAVTAYTIFGPVTEEVTKIAVALWVVEKRPYLFSSKMQILFCAVCGGMAFAAIENLLYLHVYVPEHSPTFVHWRWEVCSGLHVCCSFIAGVGLAQIWDRTMRLQQQPQLAAGVPWLVIAMVGHGLYNFAVSLAEQAGWLKFLE